MLQLGVAEQRSRALHALLGQPEVRRAPGGEAERGAEMEPAQPHQRGEFLQPDRAVQMLAHEAGYPLHLPFGEAAPRRRRMHSEGAMAPQQLSAEQVDRLVDQQPRGRIAEHVLIAEDLRGCARPPGLRSRDDLAFRPAPRRRSVRRRPAAGSLVR